ncbi:prephenate dehydratase [Candidatus Peregrinibacteria bacterium]|nr:prephenate dehydratase [Candidatus Peregrinibacteria bacterium]
MNKVIGIIGGKGLMGKYFAEFFEKSGYEVIISDRNTNLTNKQLAKKSDVVIVSVPIDVTEKVIEEVAPCIRKSGLLMDLTSLKVLPMKAMKKTKASYLGCHPIFGPTANIEGQLIILCPGNSKKWHKWLEDIFVKNGVFVKSMTANKHDELMAYIQTLIHFSDIALSDTLRKSGIPIKEFIDHQSPVYRLELDMMGRILNQDANLYANIQLFNPLSKKVLNDFIESCQSLVKTNEKKDINGYVKFFKECSKYLGKYTGVAQKESDQVLNYLNSNADEDAKEILSSKQTGKFDVAVIGPKNTYSDIALKNYLPKAKALYCASISEIFELVEKGKIKEGLVPIENSIGGSIRETLDELYSSNVYIEKVLKQPIHLSLVGTSKSSSKTIKTIYSHAQPLIQSRAFLKMNCPKASLVPVASTTTALERVKSENQIDTVAIASSVAAKSYGLTVIKDLIEDDKSNTTQFAIIKKNDKCKMLNDKSSKTSIAFNFSKDSPGSLFSVLKDFNDNKINLTKIESRPSTKERGEYVFYIDFDGNVNSSNVKKTISEVKNKVEKLKILGCY